MRLLNRLSVLLFGLALSAAGAVVLAHRMSLWGQSGDVLLPSDALLELRANRWAIPLVAVAATMVAVWAAWLLLANITPRSGLLRVSRHAEGGTQIRSSSLLKTLREDVRAELELSEVSASIAGRAGRPQVSLWVTLNPTDSPSEVLHSIAGGPVSRLRAATGDPELRVSVQLRYSVILLLRTHCHQNRQTERQR